MRYKLFSALHNFLYKIEYYLTYSAAKKCALVYQQCSIPIIGYKPDYIITDLFRDGNAIASLMVREWLSLEIEDKIHHAVQEINPKIMGGVIFERIKYGLGNARSSV